VRLQKTNGKASEWVIYTVSSDGKVFTLSVGCQQPSFKMYRSSRGQIKAAHDSQEKLARPAGLEPATSWFVVVIRKIDAIATEDMKIRRLSDLR